MNREPAVIIGSIEALVLAILSYLAWTLEWSADQTALIVGIASAAVALLSSVVVRSKVTPAP